MTKKDERAINRSTAEFQDFSGYTVHVACPFAHAKRALRPCALKGDATCIKLFLKVKALLAVDIPFDRRCVP